MILASTLISPERVRFRVLCSKLETSARLTASKWRSCSIRAEGVTRNKRVLHQSGRSRLVSPLRFIPNSKEILSRDLEKVTVPVAELHVKNLTHVRWEQQDLNVENGDWSASEWASAFENREAAADGYWLPVQGNLPQALHGTYFRNAPGRFEIGGKDVGHPFDGDGLVSTISFKDGEAFFRSQFVQTSQIAHEVKEQKRVFPCTFGTRPDVGHWMRNILNVFVKNVANTNVMEWGGRAWALFEAGQPYELDPHTLQTLDCNDFGEKVQPSLPFEVSPAVLNNVAGKFLSMLHPSLAAAMSTKQLLGGYATLSHAKPDPQTNRLVTPRYKICLKFSPFSLPTLVTRMEIREVNAAGEVVASTKFELQGYGFVHDLALTPNYYVVFQNPVSLRMIPLLLGQLCPVHCVDWEPHRPTVAFLIPRPFAPDLNNPSATVINDGCNLQEFYAQYPDPEDPLTTPFPSLKYTVWQADGSPNASETGSLGSERETLLSEKERLGSKREVLGSESGALGMNSERMSVDEMKGKVVQGVAAGYSMPAQFVFHMANAFEQDAGEGLEVVSDYIGYPEFMDFRKISGPGNNWRETDADAQPPGRPCRLTINTKTGKTDLTVANTRVGEFCSVSPAVYSRPSQYMYYASALHPSNNRPQQAIAKVDMVSGELQYWSRGWHYYVGEPFFVPDPDSETKNEDDGWVVSMCYDAHHHRSELVVMDSRNFEAGPIAILPLQEPIPHGLHGTWSDMYFGPKNGQQ